MKYVILIICLFCANSYAQPAIQWQHCYGGGNNEQNYGICNTSDGGYITIGSSNSVNGDVTGNHGNNDLWVVKIDNSGTIQWEKSYGGSGNDGALGVVQIPGGGYVIEGYKYSTDGDVTCSGFYWLIKISDTGTLIWQKCFDITLGNRADIPSLITTPDRGFVFATGADTSQWSGGYGFTDFLLVKLDSNGNTQWHKCYGGTSYETASSVWRCSDGGFLLAGYTKSNDGQVTGYHTTSGSIIYYDYWVIKTDSSGALIWQKCLGGSNEDIAYSICETSDSGAIVAGYTYSNDGEVVGLHGVNDYWVVKLSDTGSIQWSKCLGGTGLDQAQSIKQTIDGGYVIAGYTSSTDDDVSGNHGAGNYWVVKLNDTGAIKWQKCLGGSSYESANCILQTSDQGYIISGTSQSNDSNVSGNHGAGDYWVVKLYPENTGVDLLSQPKSAITIFPNPATKEFTITSPEQIAQVTITNLFGQMVFAHGYNTEKAQIDIADLPSGVYFVKINGSEVRRLVKE